MYTNPYNPNEHDISPGYQKRPEIINRLKGSLIHAKEPSNIAIVAERNMGAPMTVKQFLRDHADVLKFRIVECDIKSDFGMGGKTSDFYVLLVKHILNHIGQISRDAWQLGERIKNTHYNRLYELQDDIKAFFKAIRESDPRRPLLLVMYSFDRLPRLFDFEGGDWTWLREFYDNQESRLYYVVVSRRPLQRVEALHGLVQSMFATVFLPPVYIGLLDPPQAQELIRNPGKEVLGQEPWPDWLAARILEWGGRQPYCTEYICCGLFERIWNQNLVFTETDADRLMAIFQEELKFFFRRLYQNLDEDKLIDALQKAITTGYNSQDLESIELLTDLGYFIPELVEKKRFKLFSPLFEQFIKRRMTHPVPVEDVIETSEHPSIDDPEIADGSRLPEEEEEYILEDEPAIFTAHSVVRKAVHRVLHTKMVIKQVDYSHISNENSRTYYEAIMRREARILWKLTHRNIGHVRNVKDNPLRIFMDWVEGSSFRELLNEGRYFPPLEVANYGVKLTSALALVHQNGIIHRDIKPENIILDLSNEPVLIDFDVAHMQQYHSLHLGEDEKKASVSPGTPEYQAPEQLKKPYSDANIGFFTDIFALGLVLYELVEREPPFFKRVQALEFHGGVLPTPSQGHNMPDNLYAILCSMLRQDPLERPAAEDLHEQFEDCVYELKSRR